MFIGVNFLVMFNAFSHFHSVILNLSSDYSSIFAPDLLKKCYFRTENKTKIGSFIDVMKRNKKINCKNVEVAWCNG